MMIRILLRFIVQALRSSSNTLMVEEYRLGMKTQVSERFDHGSPWMSIETCSVQINYLLTLGQYPLIAILNDKVVGGLELYLG